MAQVHREKATTEEAMGSEELVGVAAGDDLFSRLETQVEAAVLRIAALTEEREELRSRLLAQDETIDALQSASAQAAGEKGEVETLREERDRLVRERAAAVQRVEAVLARLDRLGLE